MPGRWFGWLIDLHDFYVCFGWSIATSLTSSAIRIPFSVFFLEVFHSGWHSFAPMSQYINDPPKKMTAMTALNCSCGFFFSETSELPKNKKHFPLKEAALPKQFQHGCSSLSSPFPNPQQQKKKRQKRANRHDMTKFREGKVPIIWIYTPYPGWQWLNEGF